MGDRTPFKPYPLPTRGNKSRFPLFRAVGEALTEWEALESNMTGIFNTLIRPSHKCVAAERAFLYISAPSTRRDMLIQAAKVFFDFFPDPALEVAFSKLMDAYTDGAARRNEIAHGIVASHINPRAADYSGLYLGPHFLATRKRKQNYEPSYLFSTKELALFVEDVFWLQSRISLMKTALIANWRLSDEKRRHRY